MMNVFKKLTLLLLFLFSSLLMKASNDTLTLAKAFDWCVGDTFVYITDIDIHVSQHDATSESDTRTISTLGFTVLSRTDGGDSIVYSLQYFGDLTYPIDTTPVTFVLKNKSQSTFANHDMSNLYRGSCSVYELFITHHILFHDVNMNNLLVDSCFYYSQSDASASTFVEKIGIRYHYFLSGGGYVSTVCSEKLAHYVSACTGYIYNSVAGLPSDKLSFQLFPNPTKDKITVHWTTDNDSPFVIGIYDITGKCLRTTNNINSDLVYLSLEQFQPGYYFLKITDVQHHSGVKGFVLSK